jgi:plastocyanin
MKISITCYALVALIISALPLVAAQAIENTGGIQGNIKIWKTKVKTKGSTSGKDVVVFLTCKNDIPYEPSKERISMDQLGLIFIPHVLPIQKGTTVTFLNNDQVDHNVYFLFEKTGETMDIGTWGQGISKDHQFNDTGAVITLCKLHLEMAAYIIVLNNPYFTTAQIDKETQSGTYLLENVPPGNYTLKAWHKRLKMKGKSQDIVIKEGDPETLDIIMTKAKYAK